MLFKVKIFFWIHSVFKHNM